MRTIGTVVRGVRAPIIRQGDDIAAITAASVQAAWQEANITPRDRDVVAVTESVVARSQGNYAGIRQIAADVKAKTGGGTVGVAFPILSRNRFSLLLKGISWPAGRWSCCCPTPPTRWAIIWWTLTCWTRPGSIPTPTP